MEHSREALQGFDDDLIHRDTPRFPGLGLSDLRQRMGDFLRELDGQRESRIEQGHLMLDYVHMLISIPPKYPVAHVVENIKGKSDIYIAWTSMGKPRFTGEGFRARGYFVSTIGRDEKVIGEYIKNQEQDRRIDPLSVFSK
jgi:putative transposase